jgi:ABC-type multidrug transport system ATPase subunit
MGASGAGKTTLLNVLACRVSLQAQEGEIKANNLHYE